MRQKEKIYTARNNLPNIPKKSSSRYLVSDLKHVAIFKIEKQESREREGEERTEQKGGGERGRLGTREGEQQRGEGNGGRERDRGVEEGRKGYERRIGERYETER